ncbi:DEAD/DEAH box helicase [Nocardia africana]|uniref:ATP-dependent helicase HepA n=1 Tax=Nocardia africana TaxID=134964 RepID=A0A378X1H6_9NOCA|nr:DEAD/DEAH box helicase [Nocardia africana]MCC3312197.1 DEAD/DEAH box helicase [Nocardia africana]SUA46501.1 ATP-dependent helicase HepA [Nocardia africana]
MIDAPPSGVRDTVRLAVPEPGGTAIGVSEVTCAVVDADQLAAVEVGRAGSSLSAWQRVAREAGGPELLPAAAHAVPNAAATAIVSADRAVRAYRETEDIVRTLREPLRARLRPYQARGISWLHRTTAEYGGAVLADEMGLGKTVQAIGFLLGRAASGPQLVVCPTSLVGNWVHEITRFAPGLRPIAWRGGELVAPGPDAVLVTGYPTLRGHGPALADIDWATAIFDEAQVLKNPRTQVSRAARAVPARARVALTGTPVENHLDELWALLNLVTPSAFTHKAQFRRRYVRPIEEGSTAAAQRLHDTIEPIVLARRKIQVAATLPPKIRTDLVCDLTAEQRRLYDELLDRAETDGFGVGAERNARVLAALTSLKQVCNHPGLITGDLDELTGRSGKFDVCSDILANNLELDCPTLVFTQYRRTGELLARHCAERFGVEAPVFHGGLSQRDRGAIVTAFQSTGGPPILILSLRAAGTGLTLTRAADVVHYDRWWNPAVEAQASDRAHRIGQTRTVTITTLTSATTVEEHIAGMHDRKSALAGLGAGDGRSAVARLARLDDDHLLAVLRRKRGN